MEAIAGSSAAIVSGLPDYAFDALISRRRVLGFDSLLLSDPDGVRYVLTTAMEKYKRLVSSQPVAAATKCGRSMPTFAGREDRGKHAALPARGNSPHFGAARRKWAIPVRRVNKRPFFPLILG
jgi:hypothetical protein